MKRIGLRLIVLWAILLPTISAMAYNPADDPDILRFAGDHLVHYWQYPVPDFHRALYWHAQKLSTGEEKRVVIAAPRSFAKSTVFSFTFPLYEILQGNNHRGIIISETADLAKHWVRSIKLELAENKSILAVYGNVATGKWTEDHIICQRPDGHKFELRAKGRGAQIRGSRPDWVICDDLENDDEVRSSDQREKTLEWMDKALLNTLERDSGFGMIGTVLHPLALLRTMLDRPDYITEIYRALTPDGQSIWPEKWPVEALEARRREIGDIAFNSEYMNEPIISENPVFLKEWLESYEQESESFKSLRRQGIYIVTAVDPAITQRDEGDYTAIVTLGATFDPKPNVYVLEAKRGHWSLRDTVREIFLTHERWKQSRTIIETVAYQQALFDEVVSAQDNYRARIAPIEIKPDKDKERRAHAVTSILQDARCFFDKSDRMTQRLIDEMIMFPTGDHDDMVDAFVYALQDIKDWGGRSQKSSGPIIVRSTSGREKV